MKAVLFLSLIVALSCGYPYELRKEIIQPLYDDWESGYSETSPEIIMAQLDDFDEVPDDLDLRWSDASQATRGFNLTITADPVIKLSDLIVYQTECYNDSTYVTYDCSDPFFLSYQICSEWRHREPTFSGFMEWRIKRKQ